MRTMAVINPRSAAGRTATATGRISRLLAPLGPVKLAVTSGPRDATTRTRQALRDGFDRIVAVGGDGTVNEVVNGFFEHGSPVNPDAELGIIEFGTGGDLRKTLGIPGDPETAVHRIVSGSRRPIDVGRVRVSCANGSPDERLFVNVASFGLSGNVVHHVDGSPSFKRVARGLAFAISAAVEVLSYASRRVRLGFDGAPPEEVELIACAVCNARYFGGGMHIAPMARPDDGLLDVIMVNNAPKLELLATIPALYTGRHMEKSCVRHVRARTVHATLTDPDVAMFVETDGESHGKLDAVFDLLPEQLMLRC